MWFLWNPQINIGWRITPIYTDTTNVTISADEYTIVASKFMTERKNYLRMEFNAWVPALTGPFNVMMESTTPTANNFNYYLPNVLTTSLLTYDGAGGLEVRVHDDSAGRTVGDRHLVIARRSHGSLDQDYVEVDGVSVAQSSTIGGNTMINDAVPDLNLFVAVTSRNMPYTINAMELG